MRAATLSVLALTVASAVSCQRIVERAESCLFGYSCVPPLIAVHDVENVAESERSVEILGLLPIWYTRELREDLYAAVSSDLERELEEREATQEELEEKSKANADKITEMEAKLKGSETRASSAWAEIEALRESNRRLAKDMATQREAMAETKRLLSAIETKQDTRKAKGQKWMP